MLMNIEEQLQAHPIWKVGTLISLIELPFKGLVESIAKIERISLSRHQQQANPLQMQVKKMSEEQRRGLHNQQVDQMIVHA